MLFELIKTGRISKLHRDFFLRNQVGAYYYCGSLAHSAIVAYNPYFVDIKYDITSKDIEYKSTEVYSPDFLLNILTGLKVINSPEDIKRLNKSDIELIRSQKAWAKFKDIFVELNNQTQTLDQILNREKKALERVEKIKQFVFNLSIGLSDVAIGMLIDQLLAGLIMFPISLVFVFSESLIGASNFGGNMKNATTDKIIDRLIKSREPFYTITNQIKLAIERIDNGD